MFPLGWELQFTSKFLKIPKIFWGFYHYTLQYIKRNTTYTLYIPSEAKFYAFISKGKGQYKNKDWMNLYNECPSNGWFSLDPPTVPLRALHDLPHLEVCKTQGCMLRTERVSLNKTKKCPHWITDKSPKESMC